MQPAALKETVQTYIKLFDDELLKANQSYDYRTLARKIHGVTSVYNDVVRQFIHRSWK